MKTFFESNDVSHDSLVTLFSQAPVAMAMLSGPDFVINIANSQMIDIWGKDSDIIGKEMISAIPELEGQGYIEILTQVFNTGITYKGLKQLAFFEREGQLLEGFYDITFSAITNEVSRKIIGISILAIEVSQQVFHEKKLSDLERKYQDIVSNSLYATAVFTGENMLVEMANEGSLKIMNREKSILGENLLDIVPELRNQRFVEKYKEVYETGLFYNEDELQIDRIINGKLRSYYYNTSFKPLKNEKSGDVEAVLVTSINVTDLVFAQKKIKENEALLKHFIENVPVAVNICEGEDLVYKISNEVSEKIWGYKIDVGSSVTDTVPGIEEKPIYQELLTVLKEGIQIEKKNYEFIDQFGNKQFINYIFQPIKDDNGDVKYVMTIGYDVSEEIKYQKQLKENERKFKVLADFMPQIVWTADSDGKPNYFNQNWLNYSRSSLNSDLIEGFADAIHPDFMEEIIRSWQESLETQSSFQMEYKLKDPNVKGKYRWFLARAIPIYNDDNEIEMWIGTCTDIDDFKQLQKLKDDFLGIASHELKTPLTSLKLYSQFIERNLRKSGDDKNADIVKKMDLQINKLNDLIGDLLDVTKIQNGKIQLNVSDFSFDDLVEEIVEEQQMSAHHRIVVNSDDIGDIVADRHRISQVMSNLIGNAIKYSPEADEVLVSTKKEKGKVVFSVQDYGIGIPDEQIKHVFEQYYRVSGNLEESIPGLGLGLFISSEIIKRSDGKIYVNSERGKGSNFCFELPANQ